MKLCIVLCALLAGCASAPYDAQFCTVATVSDGVVRCAAWSFGPTKAQQINFRRHGL